MTCPICGSKTTWILIIKKKPELRLCQNCGWNYRIPGTLYQWEVSTP